MVSCAEARRPAANAAMEESRTARRLTSITRVFSLYVCLFALRKLAANPPSVYQERLRFERRHLLATSDMRCRTATFRRKKFSTEQRRIPARSNAVTSRNHNNSPPIRSARRKGCREATTRSLVSSGYFVGFATIAKWRNPTEREDTFVGSPTIVRSIYQKT